MPELRQLALHDIDEPENPMRFAMDDQKMLDLMESMATVGLLQPIGVVEENTRFRVEFGHRRYIAATRLRWTHVNALVFTPQEITRGAAMLAENVEREEVTTAEEAIMFAEARERFGLDEEGLCKRFRKSADYIGDRIALLRNDQEVFKALAERKINYSVARELNKIKDEAMRRYYLDAAVRGGSNARTVAGWRAQFEMQPQQVTAGDPPPQPTAEAESPTPNPVHCCLCGGDRDPYNLISVFIHKWELDHIQKLQQQNAEA
jgi:ParB/RepB/Spo0J family partition protein